MNTSLELRNTLHNLWREYKEQNSVDARAGLLAHYRYLVRRTRQRSVPTPPISVAPEALDQEGYTALVTALDQYPYEDHRDFQTFAALKIRDRVVDHLHRNEWRLPVRRLQARPDVDEFASLSDRELPLGAFFQIYTEALAVREKQMLEATLDASNEARDGVVKEGDLETAHDSQKSMIMRCIQWLPQQERIVVVLYYYEGWTLQQIANELSRSLENAAQLRRQAIFRLSAFVTRYTSEFPELNVTFGSPVRTTTGHQSLITDVYAITESDIPKVGADQNLSDELLTRAAWSRQVSGSLMDEGWAGLQLLTLIAEARGGLPCLVLAQRLPDNPQHVQYLLDKLEQAEMVQGNDGYFKITDLGRGVISKLELLTDPDLVI
jgi:RNA polymerase sigma factor for flagellar operon FliA